MQARMANEISSIRITRPQLPPALQLHILSFLPANDRALSGRLVSPDAAAALTGPDHCTASLSQPLPPHAAPWAVEAGQQHVRQLPFRHKLQLLCTAAASGSEANLEVALALLQPSVFPELLQRTRVTDSSPWDLPIAADPCIAAVKAGHPQLLGWLLRRCPVLVGAGCVLVAAAQHSSLGVLQAAWEALPIQPSGRRDGTDGLPALTCQGMLDAAAESATPDAVAKMEWLLAAAEGACSLQGSTAVAAARSGDLGRLRWLHDRGCPVDVHGVLQSALQHADLAVAQWLVDEAECKLPAAGDGRGSGRGDVLKAAARGTGAVAKLRWLRERGGPLPDTDMDLLTCLTSAAEKGQVEAVRYLFTLLSPHTVQRMMQPHRAAYVEHVVAASGSIPVAEIFRQAGFRFSAAAYGSAAFPASVAIVRWLACEAGVPVTVQSVREVVSGWPRTMPAQGRFLLQAVQLLAEAGGCRGWDARDAEDVLHAAARRGDVALVQHLAGQLPGPWPRGMLMVAAVECGCEALLEWLVALPEGAACQPQSEGRYYMYAAVSGFRGMLAALRRLGVPWCSEDVVVRAVRKGCCAQALRWLVEHGAPVGSQGDMEKAVDVAVRCNCIDAQTAAWMRGLVL